MENVIGANNLTKNQRFYINIFLVFVVGVMLSAALYMILNFYICDNNTCKAFVSASEKAPKGSIDYNIELINNIYIDGMWPLALIGAIIGAFFGMWLTGSPMSIINFFIIFFVMFVVLYFTFNFSIHHYLSPILLYLKQNCIPKDEIDEIDDFEE